MPQKRNPDVFELVRGRTNLIQTLPGQISAMISGLPSGYNRELQLLKDLIFNGFADIMSCLNMIIHMLNRIRINENITSGAVYNTIFSTEEVNRLVKEGIPFRDAYRIVGEKIGTTVFQPTSLNEYTHEGSIGNLCNKEIEKIFSARMRSFGSKSSAELIEKMMKY
jgi:argininosuccinate lyase